MFFEFKGITGIYAIENLKNGNIYIGSASVCLRKRFKEHLNSLLANRHFSDYLQRSFNVHGKESFRFILLEKAISSECIEAEQKWLDVFCPEYNSCTIAGSTLGIKISEVGRENMSKAKKGRTPWNKGKKTGNFSTEESKRKRELTLARNGNKSGKPAKKLTVKKDSIYVSFLSMTYCAQFCKVSTALISKKLKYNNNCIVKGYRITLAA
jgi:group I intron endonuclease